MTLNLSTTITADASGAEKAFKATRGEMEATGAAARKLGQDGKTAARGLDDAAAAAARAAKEEQAAAAAAEALRAKYVPLYAIERNRKQLLDEIAAAEKAGTISALEAADAADRVTASMNAQTAAARALKAAIAEQIEIQERAAQRAMPNSAAQVNDRLGVRTDFGSAGREADVAAWARSRDELRAKYDPLFAVQQRYVAQLREIREAERLGVLSADQATAAIQRQKSAFVGQVQGIRNGRGPDSARSDRARQQSLLAQNFDVFTSLAGGMNPLLIAAQQGPQYVQAFGGFKETGEAVKTALTGTRLAIGGVTGVLLAGAAAWNSYDKSARQVRTTLDGVGRGAGATVGDMQALEERAAALGELARQSIREVQTSFLATGRIGVEAMGPAFAMLRDFAATIGTDIETAGKQLAEILAEPAQGAATLRGKNLLDSGTGARVKDLADQNRLTEAQLLILDAVNGRLVKAKDATGAIGEAWNRLSVSVMNGFSDWGYAADRFFGGITREDRIKQLERALTTPRLRGQARAELDRLRKEEAEERRKAEQDRRAAEGSRTVDAARTVVGQSPATELDRRRAQLRSEIKALEARATSGAAYDTDPEKNAEAIRREAEALEAKKRALDGLKGAQPEADRQAELDRIDLQIRQARDPVARAELERQRALVAARGEEVTSAKAAADAQNAYNRALGEGIASGQSRVRDMREETAARAAVNDAVAAGRISLEQAEEQLRLEIELRPLIAASLKAEGAAREDLLRIIQQHRAAAAADAEERSRSSALRTIGSQRDDLETMKREIELVTAGNVVRERELALLEANRRIREIFGSADNRSPEAEAIRSNAIALADARTELDRTKAAYDDIARVGGSAIDSVTDKIVEQGLTVRTAKQALTGFFSDLAKQAATWSISNPLKNMLFGTNLPTMKDAGGVIGRLFGGKGGESAEAVTGAIASSTALMNVQATTVVVNGGISGAAGGLVGLGGGVPSFAGAAANDKAAEALSVVSSLQTGAVLPKAGNANVAGLNDVFEQRLKAMFAAAPPNVRDGLMVQSGYRSAAYQAMLYARDIRANGGRPSGMVGKPGGSMHGFGEAVDLGVNGRLLRSPAVDPTSAWVHGNAERFGLRFPMNDPNRHPYEPWHIEPIGGRRQGGVLGPQAAAPVVDAAKIAEAETRLTSFAQTTQRADTGLLGFGGNLDQTAKTIATSASGVGGSAKQLETATAQIPAQTEGFFGALGQGLDKLLSSIFSGGGGGGGIGGFFSSLFGGGGAAAAVAHTGAIMGDAGASRRVPWSFFSNAPRAHSGKLLAGERALIAKVGEGVFTPKQMDNADRLFAAALAPRTVRVQDERPRTAAAMTGPLPMSSNDRTGRLGENRGWSPEVKVINPPGVRLEAKAERRRGPNGDDELVLRLMEAVGDDIRTSGSPTNQAVGGTFGLSREAIRRGM